MGLFGRFCNWNYSHTSLGIRNEKNPTRISLNIHPQLIVLLGNLNVPSTWKGVGVGVIVGVGVVVGVGTSVGVGWVVGVGVGSSVGVGSVVGVGDGSIVGVGEGSSVGVGSVVGVGVGVCGLGFSDMEEF